MVRPRTVGDLALFVLAVWLATGVQAQTFSLLRGLDATGDAPQAPLIQGPDNTLYGTTTSGGTNGAGVVFKIQPDGSGYIVLWNFTGGDDGGSPFAGLLLSGDTLYGTTYNGGKSLYGTIFAVNTDGSGFTNLYSFTGGLDCGNPAAGLILTGGTLYGTTTGESGGIPYYGSIFKINTNGAGFAVLKTFKAGDGTGANPHGGLCQSNGLLYGTTYSGTPGYGTVFRLGISGAAFTTLYRFSGVADGNPMGGLVLLNNQLYGTTTGGTIFRISTGGAGFTVLHQFGSTGNDGLTSQAGLIVSGNTLYGTTRFGGNNGLGTLFAINSDGSGMTNLYNFNDASGDDPQAGLLLSGNTLYGTASEAGPAGGGTLFGVSLFGLAAVTNQPASQVVAAGGSVTFKVGAGGAAPLGYQWFFNNVELAGATNTSLTLTNVGFSAAGDFSVLVTNTYFSIEAQASTNSSVWSRIAELTVVPALTVTGPATEISATGAVLNGSITIGSAETVAWFDWGTDTNYGNITETTRLPGNGATTPVSEALSGLSGNIYHYRLCASNDFGIVFGNDQQVTVGLAPGTTATRAEVDSTNNAALSATVNPNGWDTTVYFMWGTRSSGPTNATPAVDIGSGINPLQFSSFTTGLTPLTQYTCQVVASNYLGKVFGPLVNFTSPLGAFGMMDSGGFYTIDTGGELVFQVSQSSGDITSLIFRGVEYQATDKNSQIASGLMSATVSAAMYGTNIIKITISSGANNPVVTNLTHYLLVRSGDPIIYMATHVVQEPVVGELRWITRLQFNEVPNGPPQSNNNGNTGAIESADVFGFADGHTTSKYYGRQRAMELTYSGATGPGVGVWSVFDTRESSSGGPFYRDIENQGDGTNSDQEIYNYLNSGHEEPEALRLGGLLYGPYALEFTTGAPPALPIDYSWIETGGVDLLGWVSATNRGAVAGVASGISGRFQGLVGFANTNAQYWAVVSANGTYATPLMKTGLYTATLYQGELGVAVASVAVTAGRTNTLNLASTETAPKFIFKIGDWDGTPAGFLNASNLVNMHPSDVRNANWKPVIFRVGTDPVGNFPAIQMRGTNTPTTILFNLSASQLANNLTLHIGMTCTYNNGRPLININQHALSYPGISPQPKSRSFTTGTWRGNNIDETYTIPAGDLVAGQNTLTITPVSGSTDPGPWLSAGWVYDAVELDLPNTPLAIPAAPGKLNANAKGSEIDLTWVDNSTNEVNFLVERSSDGVNFTLIGAVTENITNFIDQNIFPGTTFFYRVLAVNPGGRSTYTAVASAPLAFSTAAWSGGNFVLSGFGGANGNPYTVLTSTNVLLPVEQWQPVATNYFGSGGSFSVTNLVVPGATETFYRLRRP